MDLIKALILIDILSDIADTNPEGVKEAEKENDTDIRCEIEKLRKERVEKLKELEAIETLLTRLEKLENKINK